MNLPAFFAKPLINLMVITILAQFFPSDIPQDTRDEFTRETTPPLEFQIFNDDFSSMDLDRIISWFSEDLGLVKDGVLLTYDEAVDAFTEDYRGIDSGDIKDMNLVYNFGEPVGANFYQTDCWVEWLTNIDGEDTWLRFHHQFVFKIADLKWYLVQSEFIPEEPSIAFDYQDDPNAPDWTRYFRNQTTTTSLPGIGAWPLLLGTKFVSETSLHPVQGTMFNGRTWTLNSAVRNGKPTVLFFFSIQSLMVEQSEIFDQQMGFLSDLYDEFGLDDLYIFAVSDEERERFEMLADDGYDDYVPLIDETSELHANLNISVNPYVVVFNHYGTVVGISKSWHPESLDLLKDIISDTIEESKTE